MRSLKRSVIFGFLEVILIGCVTLFFIAVTFAHRSMLKVVYSDMQSVSTSISTTVNYTTAKQIEFLQEIASMSLFQDDNISVTEKQIQLNSIVSKNPKAIIRFTITDIEGNTGTSPENLHECVEIKYLPSVQKGGNVILGPLYDEEAKDLSIIYGVPVYNKGGKFIHALFLTQKGNFLSQVCSGINFGSTGVITILDRKNGNLVGSADSRKVLEGYNPMEIAVNNIILHQYKNYLTKALAGESGAGLYKIIKEKHLISYNPIPGTDWVVILESDYNEFYMKLKSLRDNLFCVMVACLIFATVVSIVVANNVNPLKALGSAIEDIASGNADLTKRLDSKKAKKEIAHVVEGFNNFSAKLQKIVKAIKFTKNELIVADEQLQFSTQDTATSITQILSNINDVEEQITSQAASVVETASAVNQIASNIESLENMISHQSNDVGQASSAIEEMIVNIGSVNSSVAKMSSSFKELESNANLGMSSQRDVNERILQIDEQSEILQSANEIISSIAEETNLLAMNAAIEAAHAGDAGKGFSVVADEIRKLSETSSEQSNAIGEELQKIKNSIAAVVEASSKTTEAFNSVSSNIYTTSQLIEQIKGAMEEQQIGSSQINDALGSMNNSTTEVRAASIEMSEGNKQILDEMRRLQDSTNAMRDSITEMTAGARKIGDTGKALAEISNQVTKSIQVIGQEIDQFNV